MINSVHKQVWIVRPAGAGWSFFTSCTARGSLLEAMTEAAKVASAGDANFAFHPLVQASINFETANKAVKSFAVR